MTRRRRVLVFGALAALVISSAIAFILVTSVNAPLERDEDGRVRSCGVRTSPNGAKYCASELAAKNPQAMHRCPEHDGAVIVKYVEAGGEESEREICCICGLIQHGPQPHADMTLDDIRRAGASDPACWQPGQICPRDGRVRCAKPVEK
jgi:hypothetical protein